MMNIWHPFDRPAFKNPLCLLDWTSVEFPADTVRYLPLNENCRPDKGASHAYRTGDVDADGDHMLHHLDIPTEKSKPVLDPSAYPYPVAPVYNPRHRWVFCSDMKPEEAWLFKQYD